MSMLASFVNYSLLPLEVQHIIWGYAIHQAASIPRIQRVAHHRSRAQDAYNLVLVHHPHLVPSALHTCSYTRTRALKIYVLWSTVSSDHSKDNIQRKVYVNKGTDIFYFGGDEGIQFWLPAAVNQVFRAETFIHLAAVQELAYITESRFALTQIKGQVVGCAHFAFNFEIYRSSFGNGCLRSWRLREMWFDTLPDIETMTIVRQVRELDGEEGDKVERRLVNVPSHYFLQDYIMASPTLWRGEWRYIYDLRPWEEERGRKLDVSFAIAATAHRDNGTKKEEWLGYDLMDLSKMGSHEW